MNEVNAMTGKSSFDAEFREEAVAASLHFGRREAVPER